MILLGMGVLGEIAFLLFFSSQDLTSLEFLYLVLAIITAAVVYFLITLQKQIRIMPGANNNK
jgi:uncharacterized protein (UPF0333 family)